MKRIWPILALLIIATLVLSACGLAQTTPTESNADWLSSAVPATLTALAQQSVATASHTETPQPTITPSPMPAPSNLKVVYSKDGSIWLWTEAGEPKQLSSGTVDQLPRISDDGQMVVFRRNNELWVVNADGTDLHVLIRDSYIRSYRPSGSSTLQPAEFDWMPNTHTFFFTTAASTETPDGVGYYSTMDLFRVDVDSKDFGQVFDKGFGGIPYFSPDGKTIALAQATIILLANADGSNLHQGMAFDPIPSGGDVLIYPDVVPLPDSSGFRVIIPTGDSLSSGAKAKLWNIPVKGVASVLSTFPNNWLPENSLSPDGNSYAYSVTSINGNDYSIKDCLHKLGMGSEKCLDQGTAFRFQSWLPDSLRFICTDEKPEGDATYYLGTINSNERTQIAGGYSITWLDNDRYFYMSRNGDLFLASLVGTQTEISKGISNSGNVYSKWSLPFDFSN